MTPLATELAALLQSGPMELDDAQARLCVASRQRMKAALNELQAGGIAEKASGARGVVIRLAGETRTTVHMCELRGNKRRA